MSAPCCELLSSTVLAEQVWFLDSSDNVYYLPSNWNNSTRS